MDAKLRRVVGEAAALVALSLAGSCAYCQGDPGIPRGGINSGGSSDYHLDPYQPTTIVSFAQLPRAIREKVLAHLVNRLGTDFFQNLRFDNGQIVDLDKMHRINPDTKQYKWIVPTYTLDFTFMDPAHGIAHYWAHIGLSTTGVVVSEINLPHMKKYGTSRVAVSVSDATQMAVKLGFNPAQTEYDLRYAEKVDAVVWRLSQVFFDNGVRIKYHYVEIDIYNGQIIKHADGYAIH